MEPYYLQIPASVPNFNFLALLISEIWRWSQNKKCELLISVDVPPSGRIFTWSHSTCKSCQCNKFQLPRSISFRDKEGVPKFNVRLSAPLPYPVPRTLKLLRVLQVLGKIKPPAKFQHRMSMHHAVMRICISHIVQWLGVELCKLSLQASKIHFCIHKI